MFGCRLKNVRQVLHCGIFCTLLLLGCAEVETKWSRKFDALGPGNYHISGVESFKEEIYITGTYTNAKGISNCFTAKYDSKGELRWQRTSDAAHSEGTAMLVISTREELLKGNKDIYVLIKAYGEKSEWRLILAKYDTLGDLKWQKTVHTHNEPLTSVLLSDHDGNVYVCGWEINPGTNPTSFIGKYIETGETSWFTSYYNEEIDFNRLRFAVTQPDYIVVAGKLETTGKLFYMKYNDSGRLLGKVEYQAEKEINDLSGLAIDTQGNTYLSATARDQETGLDCLTLVYDKEDSLRWANIYDGEAHADDMSMAIALDESLNTYVVSSSVDAQGMPGILTVKYDKAGNQLWAQRLKRKDAASPLMIDPQYLRLGRGAQAEYFYVAGTAGSNALIARLNKSGVYSFQAEYCERGKTTVPTALSSRCMAFTRTTKESSDAYIVMIGPSSILGIARWD